MKRILTGALAALIAFSAHAATLTPIQLLNPAGSTSGQVITSTGASTPPAWTTLSGIGYALTANPLSQFAATTSAQLASVISNETGTGVLVFSNSPALTGSPTAPTASAGNASTQIATTAFTQAEVAYLLTLSPIITTPTINQPNLVGTTTGAAAPAGSIGETPTPTDLTGVSITNTTPTNISSVSLTAGDYDISCVARWIPAAGASFASLNVGISATSATTPNPGQRTLLEVAFPAALVQEFGSPSFPVRPTSTTTYYCVGVATLSGGTVTANGYMHVRRVH